MFYDLAASTWGREEIEAIYGVIASDRYTMGEKVKEMELAFAAYVGARHAIMVNSGSSANLASIAALFYRRSAPLTRGDEVIVPAISWSTTYHPLQQYGLKLRFVDVELDTLNMDVTRLEEALTPRTRMIVAVSILGNPAALDVIRAFADRHGLYVLEDNCESLDAELNGRKTGTFGHLNTFSFFFSHHITTMEGGMVVTDDDELAHLVRAIRAHGWTRDLPGDCSLFEPRDDDFYEAYRFIVPGYNLRPLEMSGAVGLVQLRKLPDFTARRRANLATFQRLFGGDDRFIIQRENGKSSSFCFPIILDPKRGGDRRKILEALKTADIGYRIITGGNFVRHDCIRFFDYSTVGDLVNADIAHDRGFFVGNHPFDLTSELETLRRVLDEAVPQ
jgi:CDP-6-deoxy-D-xylo-4-hexulose-3-dehydrase